MSGRIRAIVARAIGRDRAGDGATELPGPAASGPERPTPRALALGGALGLTGVLLVAGLGLAVWLARSGDPEVDTNGIEVERLITGPRKGAAPRFSRPSGVAFGPDGSIYVADSGNDRIVVFDASGRYVRQFGGRGVAKPLGDAPRTWEPGLLNYPVDVVVDSAGTAYVADFYNDSISVFARDGSFVRRFPDPYVQAGKGSSGQDGGGIAVTAIALLGDRLYATDAYQVFEFTTGGRLLRQFGRPGADRDGLDHPNGVAVDSGGRVYVADSNNNRVKAYEPSGTVSWTRGERLSDLRAESSDAIVLPRGIAVERSGSLLVADTLGQQLVRLGQDGRVVATWGARGEAPGQMDFPNDVAVRGDLVVIADRANDRVQVVRLDGR